MEMKSQPLKLSHGSVEKEALPGVCCDDMATIFTVPRPASLPVLKPDL